MKIALVGNFRPQGGAVIFFQRQASVLLEAGHDVSLLCEDSILENLPGKKKYSILSLYANVEHSPGGNNQEIISILNDIKPDVIHFHLATLVKDVSAILKAVEIAPVVVTPHSHQFSCPSVKKIIYRPLGQCELQWGMCCLIRPYTRLCNYRHPVRLFNSLRKFCTNRKMLEKASFVVVMSRYMQGMLKAAAVPAEKIRILPPIIDAINEGPVYYKTEPTLLFAGAFLQEKGVQYLLNALAKIKVHHKALIVGDGWMMDELKQMAKDVLKGKVEFLGWLPRERLITLYRKVTVVVMPSLCPETLGLSGLEALGYGIPVVAFSIGAIPDWLVDGRNGFLVTPGNVEELASKIEQMLRAPQVASKMGRKGWEFVRDNFSAESHLKGLLSIYNEAITRGNR